MILVIGGYAQGQLEYVKKRYEIPEEQIYYGCLPESTASLSEKTIVIAKLNDWLADRLENDRDTASGNTDRLIADSLQQSIEALVCVKQQCGQVILVSDEIGNGLVPIAQSERDLRDLVGQAQIRLAESAEEVIRVICGIGQKIK